MTTTVDADLIAAEDIEHLEFARAEGRVIFTQDSDFLRLHHDGSLHTGIVFAASGTRRVGEVVRFLCLLHDCVTPEEMAGQIEFA